VYTVTHAAEATQIESQSGNVRLYWGLCDLIVSRGMAGHNRFLSNPRIHLYPFIPVYIRNW
jgi:hypothetical protein